MARPRQPANVIDLKGRAHMSKEELKKRKEKEIQAPSDAVVPPSYLNAAQKDVFKAFAKQLVDIEIMSNLDCDALARYVQSSDKYQRYDELVTQTLDAATNLETAAEVVVLLEKYEGLRDKAFKQCRASASDLGLTISSRCKLVVPKPPDDKPKNKFRELSG